MEDHQTSEFHNPFLCQQSFTQPFSASRGLDNFHGHHSDPSKLAHSTLTQLILGESTSLESPLLQITFPQYYQDNTLNKENDQSSEESEDLFSNFIIKLRSLLSCKIHERIQDPFNMIKQVSIENCDRGQKKERVGYWNSNTGNVFDQKRQILGSCSNSELESRKVSTITFGNDDSTVRKSEHIPDTAISHRITINLKSTSLKVETILGICQSSMRHHFGLFSEYKQKTIRPIQADQISNELFNLNKDQSSPVISSSIPSQFEINPENKKRTIQTKTTYQRPLSILAKDEILTRKPAINRPASFLNPNEDSQKKLNPCNSNPVLLTTNRLQRNPSQIRITFSDNRHFQWKSQTKIQPQLERARSPNIQSWRHQQDQTISVRNLYYGVGKEVPQQIVQKRSQGSQHHQINQIRSAPSSPMVFRTEVTSPRTNIYSASRPAQFIDSTTIKMGGTNPHSIKSMPHFPNSFTSQVMNPTNARFQMNQRYLNDREQIQPHSGGIIGDFFRRPQGPGPEIPQGSYQQYYPKKQGGRQKIKVVSSLAK